MRFCCYSNIFSVKHIWKELIPDGAEDVYQTYIFNKLCYIYRVTSISNIKRGNVKCKFVVGYDNNKPVCLAPLIVDKVPFPCIRLLGYGTNAGYLDYIYTKDSYAYELHKYCRNLFKEYQFEYTFVKETSPLCSMMNSVEKFNNYAVCLEEYEEYYKNLSRSTRQNIRTAYNRIHTDGGEFEFALFDKNYEKLEELLKDLNEIYQKRRLEWSPKDKPIPKRKKKIILKRDIIFQGMRKMENALIAVLYINKKPAAFFMGFTFHNGVCIPRLAIDTEYSRYSPGMILINEFLKQVSAKNFIFDLCRGDEGYKSKLRGKILVSYQLVNK